MDMKDTSKTTTLAETLRAGQPAATYTTGCSMEPLLYERKTYVILQPVTGDLKPGDLPIYQRPDGVYIIHRLIRQGEGWCYTRGDNCLHGEKIPRDWILGGGHPDSAQRQDHPGHRPGLPLVCAGVVSAVAPTQAVVSPPGPAAPPARPEVPESGSGQAPGPWPQPLTPSPIHIPLQRKGTDYGTSS